MIVEMTPDRKYVKSKEAEQYNAEFKEKVLKYVPDLEIRKRRVKPRPEKCIKVPVSVLRKIEDFYEETYDGRKLYFDKVDYVIGNGNLHFFSDTVFEDVVAVDFFVNKSLIGNMFYETAPMTQSVLKSQRKGYLAFLIYREDELFDFSIPNNLIFDLCCLTWYRTIFGDDLSTFMPRGSKTKLKRFFKEQGRYKAEHTTKSGVFKPGHFVFY